MRRKGPQLQGNWSLTMRLLGALGTSKALASQLAHSYEMQPEMLSAQAKDSIAVLNTVLEAAGLPPRLQLHASNHEHLQGTARLLKLPLHAGQI